jgi:hypothetical protein
MRLVVGYFKFAFVSLIISVLGTVVTAASVFVWTSIIAACDKVWLLKFHARQQLSFLVWP